MHEEKKRLNKLSKARLIILLLFALSLLPAKARREILTRKTKKRARNRHRSKLTGKAKAAFLRRMNAGRRRKGLKPIRARGR